MEKALAGPRCRFRKLICFCEKANLYIKKMQ